MGVKKGRLCNVPPKPKQTIVGKSTVQDTAVRTQDTTVTLYLLGRAQDFSGVYCRVAYSSGFVEWYLTNLFLKLIDMFETKDFVWFSAMPLFLCCALLSGVERTFIDEKPCPKLKAWLRLSPLRKIIHCHATNLVGFRTFREKITGLCIPQDLWKHIFQSSSSIW